MRGLALSGGGFRATLFHLGVVSYLYDVESAWHTATKATVVPAIDTEDASADTIEPKAAEAPVAPTDAEKKAQKALTGIRYITSVSGGSIFAAHLVQNWDRYTKFDDKTKFDEAASELVRFIKKDIRGRIVRRLPFHFWPYALSVLWRRAPFLGDDKMPGFIRRSPTDTLERYYHYGLFDRKPLASIAPDGSPNGRPMLHLLTTNLGEENGQADFTHEGLTTSTKNYAGESLPLARAVAASSAFPGMFPAVLYNPTNGPTGGLKLSDGGIFDNLGVRKYWDLLEAGAKIDEVLISDASVSFKASFGAEFLEPITIPIKAADILFRRVYWFEVDDANQKNITTPQCNFRFLKLRHKVPATQKLRLMGEHQESLHNTRTDLDAFSDLEIGALVRQGYCVAKDILQLPIPQSEPPISGTPWNPIEKTKSKPALALFDRDSTYLSKATNLLRKASIRKKRFVSFTDWISYLTILLLLIPVAYPFVLTWWSVQNKSDMAQQKVENDAQKVENDAQKQVISDLKAIATSSAPVNFSRKYGVPLQTDLELKDALKNIKNLGTDKGFKDVYVFFVKYEDRDVYRTIAVFNSLGEVEAGRVKAVREVNPTANEVVAFDNICPDPVWNSSDLFYYCKPSDDTLESHGFNMILQKNLKAALTAFEKAEEIAPRKENYYDIAQLLRSKQPSLATANEKEKETIWKDVFSTILKAHTYGMPADIKQQFQALNTDSLASGQLPNKGVANNAQR